MSSGDAPDSICPRGWILATYDGNKSYYNLISSVYRSTNGKSYIANDGGTKNADTSLLYSPLSFLRSGYYYWESASRDNRSSLGGYWESRSYSSITARLLYFLSTHLYPQDYDVRGYGFSVRCDARD